MIAPLHKTLEQVLLALARGASLECLVCGEFVLRQGHRIACPECGSSVRDATALAPGQLAFDVGAG